MSATGLAALTLITSPGQLAARTSPPPASVITVRARWQLLTEHVLAAGIVRAARTVAVTGSAPFGVLVVTRLPVKAGDRLRPGRVVAEVDGRPILLLRGRLPPFRSLHEGDSGPDVTQLQESLELLGYDIFDPAGEFGPSTALALELLYRHLGYAPPLFRSHRPLGERRLTPFLPMSEVVFIPSRSALVVSVSARTGSQVTAAPLLRLATGRPYVTALLTAHQAAKVQRGVPADIVAPALRSPGRVLRIGRLPVGPAGFRVVVTSTRPLPQRLIGSRVRLTLLVPVTAAPVLSVPLAAIRAGPRGQSPYVVTIAPAGRQRRVPVFTGPSADGWLAVQPLMPGVLHPGGRVLIGTPP